MENNKINSIEELEKMLLDASKGIARVDKTYVDYKEQGHLFHYKIDYKEFLEDINYILGKK
jgi:hypothetical protein